MHTPAGKSSAPVSSHCLPLLAKCGSQPLTLRPAAHGCPRGPVRWHSREARRRRAPAPAPGPAASAGPPARRLPRAPLPSGCAGPPARSAAGACAAGPRRDLGRAEGRRVGTVSPASSAPRRAAAGRGCWAGTGDRARPGAGSSPFFSWRISCSFCRSASAFSRKLSSFSSTRAVRLAALGRKHDQREGGSRQRPHLLHGNLHVPLPRVPQESIRPWSPQPRAYPRLTCSPKNSQSPQQAPCRGQLPALPLWLHWAPRDAATLPSLPTSCYNQNFRARVPATCPEFAIHDLTMMSRRVSPP